MNTPKRTRIWIGGLVLVAAIALAVQWIGAATAAQPAGRDAPTVVPTPLASAYPAPPTAPAGKPTEVSAQPQSSASEIPTCVFSPNATPTENKPAVSYNFGEPRGIFTSTTAIQIAQWLPDSQRVLMVQSIRKSPRENIQTIDIYSSDVRILAERQSLSALPVWLSSENKIAFSDVTDELNIILRVVGESEQTREDIATLSSAFFSIAPQRDEFIYFPTETPSIPQKIDVASKVTKTLELPSSLPEIERAFFSSFDSYRVIWSPDGERVVFYWQEGFYLMGIKENSLCEVVLDYGWAFNAKWSPDSQYISMIMGDRPPPFDFTELVILNMQTGEQYRVPRPTEMSQAFPFFTDMAWAPDSRQLVFLATVAEEQGFIRDGLFLFNILNKESNLLFPNIFFRGNFQSDLSWSPDGSFLVLLRPNLLFWEPPVMRGEVALTLIPIRIILNK